LEVYDFNNREQQKALGEAYTIKIKLGFLITAIAGLISVIAIFISLRTDVVALLKTVASQQEIITQVQSTNFDLRIQIQSINDSLNYLKAAIEADRQYHRQNDR